MRKTQESFIRWSIVAWMILSSTMLAASAQADILPFVLDETGDGNIYYWWSTSTPQIQGEMDKALFSNDVSGIVSPVQRADLNISRVFQRPELSTSNAKQIATMAGASVFFMGRAQKSSTQVAWLSSTAVTVTIRGTLYDTRSASVIDDVELQGYGVGATDVQALRVAMRSAARHLARFQPRTDGGQRVEGESLTLEIVVQAPSTSDVLENVRVKVENYVKQIGNLSVCRISDGEIALCVHEATQTPLDAQTIARELHRELPDFDIEKDHAQPMRLIVRSHGSDRPSESRDRLF